jgi:hypothetical protein
MYSPNAFEESKIVEVIFIAGVTRKQVAGIVFNDLEIKKNEVIYDEGGLIPEFFFAFPDKKEQISSSILDVIRSNSSSFSPTH